MNRFSTQQNGMTNSFLFLFGVYRILEKSSSNILYYYENTRDGLNNTDKLYIVIDRAVKLAEQLNSNFLLKYDQNVNYIRI